MKQYIKAYIALISIALVSMTNSFIISGFSVFCQDFPDYEYAILRLAITMPNLASIFTALLSGILHRRISMRNLAIFGLGVEVVGGVAIFFADSLPLILGLRLLIGLGKGFTSVAMVALVPILLPKEQHSRGISAVTVAACIGGVAFSYVGGVLANYSWRYGYLLFLCLILPMVMLTFVMDRQERSLDVAPDQKAKPSGGFLNGVSLALILTVVLYAIYTIGCNAYSTDLALIFTSLNLGDATDAGVAGAVANVGGFLGGLVFVWLSKRFRHNLYWLVPLITGLSMFVMSGAASKYTVHAMAFVFGVVYYIGQSDLKLVAFDVCGPGNSAIAASVTTFGLQASSFLCPLILSPLAKALLGSDTSAPLFACGGMICMVSFLGAILFIWKRFGLRAAEET